MDEPVAETRPEVCHRCLQPVPQQAQRCPHCGDPLVHKANVPLVLGMVGLLIVVLIAFFAVRLMHSGAVQPPPDDGQQGQEQTAPHPNPPPEPAPKPALGQ